MIQIRRRVNPIASSDDVDDDASGEKDDDGIHGSFLQRNKQLPIQKTHLLIAFIIIIIIIMIMMFPFGKSSILSNDEDDNSVQHGAQVVMTKSSKSSLSLIQTSYNVSELCSTHPPTQEKSEEDSIYFECGQTRLMKEYVIKISLESLQFDPSSGVGHITATMCQPDCFHSMFNASDILLWVRLTSPEVVLAVSAQPIDCRSWRADFHIPKTTTVSLLSSSSSNSIVASSSFQVDVVVMWLNGNPKKHWISDFDRTITKGKVWIGGKPYVSGFPRIYGESIRDGRWMKCSDWCYIHKECTHWTFDKSEQQPLFIFNPKRCQMYSNVTGLDKGSKGGTVQSGYFDSDEHRVTYLGGLSIQTEDITIKQTCREMAHVFGSPTTLNIPPQARAKNNGRSNNKELSQLPWCSAGDNNNGRQKKKNAAEGFWARASTVYPTMTSDNNNNCPEPCVTTKSRTCTPADSLQGICSFNDVSPTGIWREYALDTAEPPIKGLAWVERDCRYRLGIGHTFQQCLNDNKFDVIMVQGNDIFGDLLDRWKLGRVDQWNGKTWKEGFVYRDGVDWLLPTTTTNIPVLPDALHRHWQDRNNNNNNNNTGGGIIPKPVKAVVVQHTWSIMQNLLYSDHKFDNASFEKPIQKQIEAWQQALSSSSEEKQEGNWISKDTLFVAILSPLLHEFSGDPYYTYEAIEHYNELARKLYSNAGWNIVDAMPLSRSRPDYRMSMSWWNAQEDAPVPKISGSGVVYTIANMIYNSVCHP